MRYAIDRIQTGSEREVNADEFEGIRIISKHNRFYCPECGEMVFFRSRGGNHPNHFVHRKKTDTTPECDKRVDGHTKLTLIQHIGLPLFLTKDVIGVFRICMGFPALGSDIIDRAEKENTYITIECGTNIKSEKLDHTSFVSDKMTILPVDFAPINGDDYRIVIHSNSLSDEINPIWSNFSDGFGKNGAVFAKSDHGGKKIRCGGSISTNKEYYFVSTINLDDISGLHSKKEGIIRISGKEFGVYSVSTDLDAHDEKFKQLSDLLVEMFDVWLLECAPEIIPLWPPIVDQDYLIPITTGDITCAISSGNAVPSVYAYSGNEVSKKRIERTDSGRFYLSLLLTDDPLFISVDRKYAGREIGFSMRKIERDYYKYDFRVLNDNIEYRMGDMFEGQLMGDLSIVSNSKCNIYIEYSNSNSQLVKLRNSEFKTKIERPVKGMCFFSGKALVWDTRANTPLQQKESNIENQLFENEIRILSSGRMVDIPSWAVWFITEQKRKGDEMLYNALVSATKNGQIYSKVLKRLSEVY